MWPNLQISFTEEILNGKLYSLCSLPLVIGCHSLSLDVLLVRCVINSHFFMFYFEKNLQKKNNNLLNKLKENVQKNYLSQQRITCLKSEIETLKKV